MSWKIFTDNYDKDNYADLGNRFLIGNGYAGVRGTLDEYDKSRLVAVNLAGIHHQATGWREPLNAPNPFYTVTSFEGEDYQLPNREPIFHSQSLDYRHGIMYRETHWDSANGGIIKVKSQRFISLANFNVMGSKYEVTSTKAGKATITTGIDADIWDINGPHYNEIEYSVKDNTVYCTAKTDTDQKVAVGKKVFCDREYSLSAENGLLTYNLDLVPGETVTFTAVACIYTSGDNQKPFDSVEKQLDEVQNATVYDELIRNSTKAWEAVWDVGVIKIKGDTEAEEAVNYSIYHINCIAPRHSDRLSIAARGLSGQTYKGAVFWDTEIFIQDYFLHTQPEIVKSFINYRIDGLKGAKIKAKEYGFEGAYYAWESQEDGFEACSDYNVTDVFTGRPVRTYFRDKQVHVSAAIVIGIMNYLHYTKDYSVLENGGAEVIMQVARFYWSILVKPAVRNRWEIHDVVGPDEYHERVNNNAYTNKVAGYVFDSSLEIFEYLEDNPQLKSDLDSKFNLDNLKRDILDVKDSFYIPQPNKDGIIEQFDGYYNLEDTTVEVVRSRLKDPREYWGGGNGVASDTQILKQADVVTMLELFHEEYSKNELKANWEFYEPRTEHGSSLSACMYGLVACRFDEPNLAYDFFMKTATAEIRGGGKQWAGLVYIGGTHPAAAGGAWKMVAQGFAGLEVEKGKLTCTPNLPDKWEELEFNITHLGTLYKVHVLKDSYEIIPL